MNVLIVGGKRHGEWLDLMDGSGAWVDIRTAETYPVRAITWAVADAATSQPTELYRLMLAVSPVLMEQGPQAEQQLVSSAVTSLAMTDYMRAHAEPQRLEPAPAPLVPGDLAAMFDQIERDR